MTTSNDQAIIVNRISKRFQVKEKKEGLFAAVRQLISSSTKEIIAVDKINFSVMNGEAVGVIGPNGAGKSTLVKMLVGILTPSEGNAEVLGFDPWKDRQDLTKHIGALFGQKPQLWYHLPPQDTFLLLAKIYRLSENSYKGWLNNLIDVFSIKDFLYTPVRKLSLGQRMRCEVVASLLHKPSIVFLDEPTIGLDAIAKQSLRDAIQEMNRKEGTTIILTSHDMGDVAEICKRLIIINRGKLIFDDSLMKFQELYVQRKIVRARILNKDISQLSFSQEPKRIDHNLLEFNVDTKTINVQDLLREIIQAGECQDITVHNPTMDELIRAIYQSPQ